MNIQSVASVSAIVGDVTNARSLFVDGLGLTFEGGEGDYAFTEKLAGVRHFGLWPLHEAATACFGSTDWPPDVPTPHASIEFEVGSAEEVQVAANELRAAGYELVHEAKTEPWGQTITRLLNADGLLVGVCYTPWFHDG
jgi:catechol 2,3-dioxygenase-like lactoylglutathione lyase family enzyme